MKADDEVAEGQVLVVVEAMKMQNELHARRAGTVKAVYVSVGQRVDQGRRCWCWCNRPRGVAALAPNGL